MLPHRSTLLQRALPAIALLASAACHRAVLVNGPADAPTASADSAGTVLASEEATTLRDRQLRSRDVTYSQAWRGRSVTRIEELLVGMPGVQVTSLAGRGFSVRIRGVSTFYGSTEPLYVVDGMPLSSGPNGLLGISPGDVRKIEVLKDAGSLAMYGVRGGNGVILITTGRR